jgi:hypothetical protein
MVAPVTTNSNNTNPGAGRYKGKLISRISSLNDLNAQFSARHQWLTIVIRATREAEIRRIAVRGQLRQMV